MAASVEKMHLNDHSIGENHVPSSPLHQLQYNIANMKLGRIELGVTKWWNFIMKVVHDLEYMDLDHVLQGRFLPQFVADRLTPEYREWARSRLERPEQARTGKGLQHNSRITRALEVLSGASLGQLGFATVVANFTGTEEEAIAAAEKEAKRLDQFIRRRFRDAVSLMFPEVDLKVAKDVNPSLLPHVGWTLKFDPQQRIFKIHFHGLIYVPGLSPAEIEQAFKRTANGKRSRLYSGANQVRVIPVAQVPGFDDGTPDAEGVVGYATKYVYNPPVKARMLEGFVSWLHVTDAILKNSRTIVVTGVRAGVRMVEEDNDVQVNVSKESSEYDQVHALGDSVVSSLDVIPYAKVIKVNLPVSFPSLYPSQVPSIGGYNLYSLYLSIWCEIQKWKEKKKMGWMCERHTHQPDVCQIFHLAQGP